MVSLSTAAQYLLELARMAPERVAGAAFIGPLFPYTPSHRSVMLQSWHLAALPTRRASPVYRWWARCNAVHWREDYSAFAEWFISRCFPEPHSTKAHRGRGGLGAGDRPRDADRHRLDGESGCASRRGGLCGLGAGPPLPGARDLRRARQDHATPRRPGAGPPHRRQARGGGGAGHFLHARKPVQVNLALRDFSEDVFGRPRTPRDPTVYRPDGRPRALYVSSPIGLGHAQRDVAIARELRRLEPDLQIDWLAQDPVTRVLDGGGRAHPSGQRPPGQRVAPHRVGVRRARPALLPGAAPHGRDPRRQLHALPRRRARRALRPLDRGRGLGARLLPAREPAARSGSHSLG